jgi:uncharacterized phage protein (TIGR01671 family)
MRTIKFRVWDALDEKMIYFSFSDMLNRLTAPTLHNGSSDWYLMQFTGLTNSKGVQIFEGDIIKRPYRDLIVTGVVVYSSGFATFKTEFDSSFLNDFSTKTLVNFAPHEMDQIDVIGNIHQNPELLSDKSGR